MSYILDALKKSEQQRQRSKGPSLDALTIAPYSEKSNSYLLYGLICASLVQQRTVVLDLERGVQHGVVGWPCRPHQVRHEDAGPVRLRQHRPDDRAVRDHHGARHCCAVRVEGRPRSS